MKLLPSLGATLAVMIYACAPDADDGRDRHTPANTTAVPVIGAEAIADLEQRYPRLGEEPLPEPQPSGDRTSLETTSGEATFYARRFEGRRTASGIPFRHNQMVAAHRAYPFGTILRVTNTKNGNAVNVRVVDRGPFGNSAAARRTVLDLSERAAQKLNYIAQGRTPVKVEVLEWGRGLT